jgi:hypothetical protein
VQWEVASLEPKSTTVYDAGFTMIAVIPKFKLTHDEFMTIMLDKYLCASEPNYNKIKNEMRVPAHMC